MNHTETDTTTANGEKPSILQRIYDKTVEKLKIPAQAAKDEIERRASQFGEVAEDAVATTAAGLIQKETTMIVEQVKADSKPIIEGIASKIDSEKRDSWEIIRDKIAPNGGFFNLIFARVLWIGAKISAFVGAIFVDKITEKDEADANRPNIERIFASLMGWLFKNKKREEINKQYSKPNGIPQSYMPNTGPVV